MEQPASSVGGSTIRQDQLGKNVNSNSNQVIMSPNSTNSLNRTGKTNKEDNNMVRSSKKNGNQVLVKNNNPRNSVESAINEDDLDL